MSLMKEIKITKTTIKYFVELVVPDSYVGSDNQLSISRADIN